MTLSPQNIPFQIYLSISLNSSSVMVSQSTKKNLHKVMLYWLHEHSERNALPITSSFVGLTI